ncbi:hypothetical protein GGQ85_003556 [Nitrobacter vulgaris]|nr:hypothetical protein [Nitrobacter vulgaris]
MKWALLFIAMAMLTSPALAVCRACSRGWVKVSRA